MAAARLSQVKFRRSEGKFLLEGPQGVRAALDSNAQIERLFLTPEGASAQADILSAAQARAVPVVWCDESAMSRLAASTTPAGVVAVCAIESTSLESVLHGSRHVVALWQANDPGNVGTIIRTADAMGVGAVVLTTQSVDPYNDKCVRSTAGSIMHVPVATGVSTEDLLAQARAAGFSVLASAMHGMALNTPQVHALLCQPVMWLFGSEAHGLPDELCAAADAVVAVPMVGRAESLNLGVAAGICMYATALAQASAGT
jgi:TrmH family RNA methyltransferase